MPINTVIIEGNLTMDPELKHTESGSTLCKFRIASNEKRGDGEDVTFVDVTCWDPKNSQDDRGLASRMAKYLTKGDRVTVEGRLSYDEWQDRDSGQKRSKLSITGFKVHFNRVKYFEREGDTMGDHRGSSGGQNQGGGTDRRQPAGGHGQTDFDDIPF